MVVTSVYHTAGTYLLCLLLANEKYKRNYKTHKAKGNEKNCY